MMSPNSERVALRNLTFSLRIFELQVNILGQDAFAQSDQHTWFITCTGTQRSEAGRWRSDSALLTEAKRSKRPLESAMSNRAGPLARDAKPQSMHGVPLLRPGHCGKHSYTYHHCRHSAVQRRGVQHSSTRTVHGHYLLLAVFGSVSGVARTRPRSHLLWFVSRELAHCHSGLRQA